MTTLDDHKTLMLGELPAFLHGDEASVERAFQAIAESSALPDNYGWTVCHLATISADDLRRINAPILASVPDGRAFFGFQGTDEDTAETTAAMRIVVALANKARDDDATLIRSLLEQPDAAWAFQVLVALAKITRRIHAQACGEQR